MRLAIVTSDIGATFGRNEQGIMSVDNLVESVVKVQETGISVVDLVLATPEFYSGSESSKIRDNLSYLKKKGKLTYSAHLPYDFIDISSLDEKIRRLSVEQICEAIEFCEELGVEVYVLHPTSAFAGTIMSGLLSLSKNAQINILKEVMKQSEHSLEQISHCGVLSKLCVENLPHIPFEYYVPLIDKNRTSICLDIGHIVMQKRDPIDLLEKYRGKIRIIHLHDVIEKDCGQMCDHQPLGTGILQLKPLIEKIGNLETNPIVALECRNLEDNIISWEEIKKIRTDT